MGSFRITRVVGATIAAVAAVVLLGKALEDIWTLWRYLSGEGAITSRWALRTVASIVVELALVAGVAVLVMRASRDSRQVRQLKLQGAPTR